MWFYRLLMRALLPTSFRRRWGAEMLDEAGAQLDEAANAGARARVHVRLVVDLLGAALREWHDEWTAIREGGTTMTMVRTLVRAPGFTAAATLTLAVAVAVNALAYAAVGRVLLTPLPYENVDRLVAVWTQDNWSREMIDLARAELEGAERVEGYGGVVLTLAEGGTPVERFGLQVTWGLHDVLGVAPALGRGFAERDAHPGAEPVTVLSHELWLERFGADPGVVGRTIELGSGDVPRRRVIGVMPAGYRSIGGPNVSAWIPVDVDPTASTYGTSYFMAAVARLTSGAELDGFRAEVRRWAASVQERHAGWFTPEQAERADAQLLTAALVAGQRTPVLLALGGVLLLLLVACANVANLTLARSLARERELSVRAALGAGRGRVLRLVLGETALLGALGAGSGLVLALGLRALLERYAARALPPEGLPLTPGPLFATLVIAVGAGLLAGLVPALLAAGGDPARAMNGARGSVGSRGTSRLQGALVTVQLALATALVASAALLGKSLASLAAVDPGFEPAGAVTFRLTAPPAYYPSDADVVRYFQEVRSALETVPGVERAGFVSRLPLGGGTSRITVYPEGLEVPEGQRPPQVEHRLVTPGFFEAIGATLRSGEAIGLEHDQEAEVVTGVVNRTAAERFWPGENAVGRHFVRSGAPWLRVVGVVEDLRETSLDGPVGPALYIVHRDWPWRTMSAVVRTRGEADVRALEAAVWSVSPVVPVSGARPLDRLVAGAAERVRLLAFLAATLGVVALTLGVLGVYGVVSHQAARRRREYGVRAALGAGAQALQGRELLRAGRMVAVGVAVGLPGAWLVGRSLRSLLHGVTPLSPSVLVPVVLVLAGVALAAAWLPVRRATRVDPVVVLRSE